MFSCVSPRRHRRVTLSTIEPSYISNYDPSQEAIARDKWPSVSLLALKNKDDNIKRSATKITKPKSLVRKWSTPHPTYTSRLGAIPEGASLSMTYSVNKSIGTSNDILSQNSNVIITRSNISSGNRHKRVSSVPLNTTHDIVRPKRASTISATVDDGNWPQKKGGPSDLYKHWDRSKYKDTSNVPRWGNVPSINDFILREMPNNGYNHHYHKGIQDSQYIVTQPPKVAMRKRNESANDSLGQSITQNNYNFKNSKVEWRASWDII